MDKFKESEKTAKEYLKKLEADGRRRGVTNSGDLIFFDIEYFDLKFLCEMHVAILDQHRKLRKLINLCNEVAHIEDEHGNLAKRF